MVATVLLIAMVVVIALIIFLWLKSFTQEAITKFGGENVELVCGDVSFDSSYSNGNLIVDNIGNVPIYSVNLVVERPGSHETYDIRDISADWPSTGLGQEGLFSGDIGSYTSRATKINVVPILVGTSKSGDKTYTCKDQYGEEITI